MNENYTTFYARYRAKIINCEYQKKFSICDGILHINIVEQTISYNDTAIMANFKPTQRPFDKSTKFIVLEDIYTQETHYLQLHFNEKNVVYCFELTNSKDTGHIYFDATVKKI